MGRSPISEYRLKLPPNGGLTYADQLYNKLGYARTMFVAHGSPIKSMSFCAVGPLVPKFIQNYDRNSQGIVLIIVPICCRGGGHPTRRRRRKGRRKKKKKKKKKREEEEEGEAVPGH